jgi:Zn-dependent protease with chaperone function
VSTQAPPLTASGTLTAKYFDGQRAKGQTVGLRLTGDGLTIEGEGLLRTVPLREVHWPERTRHGKRVAHLAGGGSLQCDDSAAWDAWAHDVAGRRDTLVVRLQQSWRWVAASALALVLLLASLYQWGVPLAAEHVADVAPREVDEVLGQTALEFIDEHLMRPTTLSDAQQQNVTNAMERMVGRLPRGTVPHWTLAFRHSLIGPNAFALPDGTLVLTDELVRLVDQDEQVICGVLAHELGHLAHRDALRMLVQTTALGTLAALVVGDFSTLAATVPALLGQASYSRDAEHAADEMAVSIMKQAGIPPDVMVVLFDRLAQQRARAAQQAAASAPQTGQSREQRRADWLGIAFASHPADADRVRFFKEAAGR